MFKIIFQYFDRYDERREMSLHGETKDQSYSNAYNWALANGDVSVIALYDMRKVAA